MKWYGDLLWSLSHVRTAQLLTVVSTGAVAYGIALAGGTNLAVVLGGFITALSLTLCYTSGLRYAIEKTQASNEALELVMQVLVEQNKALLATIEEMERDSVED